MFRKTVRDLNAGAVFRLGDSTKRNTYYELRCVLLNVSYPRFEEDRTYERTRGIRFRC
jgi:hypothetical protein